MFSIVSKVINITNHFSINPSQISLGDDYDEEDEDEDFGGAWSLPSKG